MPINCNQPNVYQYGESWTTKANEYHTLCAAYRTTSLNTKYQETVAAAPADSHGGDHTAQFVAASPGGRRSIASAFLFIAALEHAILHWSVRKQQPQRIEFEIKCSWLFCKTYKSFLLPQISPNQVESTHTFSHNHCSKVGM